VLKRFLYGNSKQHQHQDWASAINANQKKSALPLIWPLSKKLLLKLAVTLGE
jgi:hypothetical protein